MKEEQKEQRSTQGRIVEKYRAEKRRKNESESKRVRRERRKKKITMSTFGLMYVKHMKGRYM